MVMLENARATIFYYKDEMESRNLINMFVNKVTVAPSGINILTIFSSLHKL